MATATTYEKSLGFPPSDAMTKVSNAQVAPRERPDTTAGTRVKAALPTRRRQEPRFSEQLNGGAVRMARGEAVGVVVANPLQNPRK